jgi:hypothetical protein
MTDEKESRNMSDENLNGKIKLVMAFGLNRKQLKEIKTAAARKGVPLLNYLYGMVLTEPGRFIVPLGTPAREAGGYSSGCEGPQ